MNGSTGIRYAVTSPSQPRSADTAERELALVESIADWMDRRYLDPIIGFVLPGVGDFLGSLVGLLAVAAAFRLRAHPVVIARMLLNLALDAALGALPIVGDAADVFYRAHSRNLRLLRERTLQRTRPSDWLLVCGALLLFLAALAAPLALGILLVRRFG